VSIPFSCRIGFAAQAASHCPSTWCFAVAVAHSSRSNLTSATVHPRPSSTTTGFNLTSFRGYNFTLAECFDLLLRASRLIRCEFFSIRNSTPPTRTTRVFLANLEVLTLEMASDLDTVLLDSLTLPRLRSLSLACTLSDRFIDIPFLSFLQRAPSVQTFSVLFYDRTSHENGVIVAILRAMPVLTSLEL
jgi:hypothetical protein